MDYFVCHNHLCLVFELLGMNLYELLRKNKFKGLHLGAIRGMMKQLLGALDLLRDAHVVHCDIKPENILLCRDDSFQVKLVDFGSACFQNRTVYQYIQSRFYRSPEVFLGMPYGMPIDMWSLGCVAAELFLGLPIFPGSSEYDLLSRICETIGTPPADMLAKAPNTNKFFTRVDIGFDESSSSLASSSGSGTSRYKLLSLREFEARSGRRAAMGKKYFKYTEFSDIIASIPYQSSKVDPNDHAAVDAEKKARMVERSAFYDLLTGMMEIDPAVRWTPAQALKHPFITGEPFDEPFAPKPIPERTTPEEREELQRVAAKEAAKVSSGEPVKKKKKPIPRDVPPMAEVMPPTPPAIPVGGLAAAFAASSASGSAPPIQANHTECSQSRRRRSVQRSDATSASSGARARRCGHRGDVSRKHPDVAGRRTWRWLSTFRRRFIRRVVQFALVLAVRLLHRFAARHEQRGDAPASLWRLAADTPIVEYGFVDITRGPRGTGRGRGAAPACKSTRPARRGSSRAVWTLVTPSRGRPSTAWAAGCGALQRRRRRRAIV